MDESDKHLLASAIGGTPRTPIDLVTPEEICIIASSLANNKSSGLDGIPSEFFKYAPTFIYDWMSAFINGVLTHCHVPAALTDVLIRPVIKNRLKDPTDSANYRPIALSSSASKLIESVIYERAKEYLTTSANQFGFKRNHSTDMCIFALKETVNYYYSMNTPVFAGFIDIKNAFDRVSHSKLFLKLIERGVPIYIILLLRSWYMTQRLYAAWGSTQSEALRMSNGIRQGSIISPYLFNVYVDELNVLLAKSKLGCHVGGKPLNNFSYADDLAIIAPTARALNGMLVICSEFARENHIEFSASKSVVLVIVPPAVNISNKPNIFLGRNVLSYVEEFKYLGHIISQDLTDDADIDRERRNLAIRGNMLVHKFYFCSEDVKATLFRCYCSQLYCCSIWSTYRQSTMNRLKVTFNKVMRRLMGLPPWCSASTMFVHYRVHSFQEIKRIVAYGLQARVENSESIILCSLNSSDASIVSRIRAEWVERLAIR